MKHISDTISLPVSEKNDSVDFGNMLDPKCSKLVDLIFLKFSLLCREFDSIYGDPARLNAEKLQWTLAFTKRNLREKAQIQEGMDAIEEHQWGRPMQLGQFLGYCMKTKPQTDTIDHSYMFAKGIESDEHKEKKKKVALNYLEKMKEFLK